MEFTLIFGLYLLNLVVTSLGCINGGTGAFIQIGSSCYQVVSESVPRQTASERCTAGGGALGTVSSEATLTALGDNVKVQSEGGVTTSTVFWLAMNRTRGRILTDNGLDVSLPDSLIQPSAELPTGECILLSLLTGDPTLTTADCTRTFWMYGYICQYASYSNRIEMSSILGLLLSLLWIS
uniref:Uncharacterized protein LOC111133548 n=1 Tax=Crassostrea virginica TaxID=6565 RepID=A0A8B8EDJ1_CRAVI|nr:uncharacterized protein LOC111133548 [Crassostrea virginica]